MLDSAAIRSQFPTLNRLINGRPIVYLDSAATALSVKAALEAEYDYHVECGANIHRGKHALSMEASELFESARATIAEFIHARSPREIVFTSNATTALNLVASGLRLDSTDEVLTTTNEHHSNLLPWMRSARVRFYRAHPDVPMDPFEFLKAISAETKVVVLALASNVTGVVQPAAAICRACRDRGITTVVDASQAIAHFEVDVQEIACDFLAFSGHKVFATKGTGVLYGQEDALARLEPLHLGGGTVDRVSRSTYSLRDLPHRLEAGTPNVGGAIGLAAALRWLRTTGYDAVRSHGESLADALIQGLSGIRGLRVLAARRSPRIPVVSALPEGVLLSADDLSMLLSDRYGIMTRSGMHCAHPLFESLGARGGAIRASASLYNTQAEIDELVSALDAVLAPFRP